jgi:hypothetical protein
VQCERITDLRTETAAEYPADSAGNILTQQIRKHKTKSRAEKKKLVTELYDRHQSSVAAMLRGTVWQLPNV